MTFWDDEKSVEQGQPLLLLDFAAGTTHWRYATTPCDFTWDGHTYIAQGGLRCGEIEVAQNAMRSRFEVTVPWSCPLVQLYLTAPPDGIVTLVSYRGHTETWSGSKLYGAGLYGAGLYGGAVNASARWRGYVQSMTMRENHLAKITCVPNYTSLGRGGLCLRYGRLCQVPLYSTACGIARSDYATTGSVDSLSGYTVTSTTFGLQADGYWVGGEFASGGYTRLIVAHTGDVVTLATVVPGLAALDSFTAYPGCDHVWASDCKTVFSNTANFRGQPHIPQVNPNTEGVR